MTARRLIAMAGLLWVAAGATYGALRAVYGSRPAYVHVRWSESVDDPARASLERRYSLIRGEFLAGTAWSYDLADLSTGNIRSLVENPRVDDTHNIHRSKFRAGYRTPRGRYVGAEDSWLPVLLEAAIVALALTGLLALGLGAVVRTPAASVAASRIGNWLANRIPPATPEAVAVFRVLLGAVLTWIPLRQAVISEWVMPGQIDAVSRPQAWALSLLAASPGIVDWFGAWILAWGALFVAGFLSRTSFVMLCVGVFAWATVYTTRIGSHQISALLVALPFLAWSRWGDTWSVDAWLRGARGVAPKRGSPREYGYTVWLPGLVLGVAFAAAAFAKIRGGPEWILNGTVKYHFLSDSGEAMVDWGLLVARYPGMAIALSFSVVAIESLVIVGVLCRRYVHRALAGLAGMSLLFGFMLFHGLVWPAWWALLLSFLPWHRLGVHRHHVETGLARLTPMRQAQLAAALLVVIQQVVVSALKLEIGPVLSAYDMYSTTYEGPADYERKEGMTYWLIVRFDDGTAGECNVSREDSERVAHLGSGGGADGAAVPTLERCINAHRLRAASTGMVRTVAVEGRWVGVDWNAWRPAGPRRVTITPPIDLAASATP